MPNLGKSQNIIALAILIVKIPNTNGTNEKVITQGFIFALQTSEKRLEVAISYA